MSTPGINCNVDSCGSEADCRQGVRNVTSLVRTIVLEPSAAWSTVVQSCPDEITYPENGLCRLSATLSRGYQIGSTRDRAAYATSVATINHRRKEISRCGGRSISGSGFEKLRSRPACSIARRFRSKRITKDSRVLISFCTSELSFRIERILDSVAPRVNNIMRRLSADVGSSIARPVIRSTIVFCSSFCSSSRRMRVHGGDEPRPHRQRTPTLDKSLEACPECLYHRIPRTYNELNEVTDANLNHEDRLHRLWDSPIWDDRGYGETGRSIC